MPDDPKVNPGEPGGEPAQPQVAPGSQSDQELLASLEAGKGQAEPDPNAEFWAKAKEIDFSKAPDEVRAKVEAPFLSQYGKKTTELERQRKEDNERLLGIIERFMATKDGQQQPTVDQREELRQKLAEGDVTAVEGLMERMFQDRYGGLMTNLSNKQAIETAAQLMPELPKYEQQVAEVLKGDQNLLYLASVNNRQFAPQVLAGLAYQAGYYDLKKQNEDLGKTIEAAKRQAVEDYKNQLRGLPTSTSQAGKTPTAFPPEKPLTLDEIRDKAWADAGGH